MEIREGNGTTEVAERLVELYRKEGLDAPVAKAYEIASIEYKKVGNVRMARKYAKLAVEMGSLWLGPGSLDWRRMKTLLAGLEDMEMERPDPEKQEAMG
jgi:hypothetical protein